MTAVERAAEVLRRTCDQNKGCGSFGDIAQALADAGLLVSDETAAVIEAAKRWRRGARGTIITSSGWPIGARAATEIDLAHEVDALLEAEART